MNTIAPLFLAIATEIQPLSRFPESSGELIAGVVISLFIIVVAIFLAWLLGPESTAGKVEKGNLTRTKAIKAEFLKLTLQLDRNHVIEQRMAELEEEYRQLQSGGPFRTFSLKDELEKNRAVQLLKEFEESGPLP